MVLLVGSMIGPLTEWILYLVWLIGTYPDVLGLLDIIGSLYNSEGIYYCLDVAYDWHPSEYVVRVRVQQTS